MEYKNLTDGWRKIDGDSSVINCDKDNDQFDGHRWFRFTGPAGEMLATTEQQGGSCGTYGVSWMNGIHPTTIGEVVTRSICFSFIVPCDPAIHNTKVVRCRNYDGEHFYLYQLQKPPTCDLAYCAVSSGKAYQKIKAHFLETKMKTSIPLNFIKNVFTTTSVEGKCIHNII